MSVTTDQPAGGLGGGAVLGATTSVTAGAALAQSGLLPQTGSSSLGLIISVAILTFVVMIASRLISKVARIYLSRQA